jgi:hypothetical protein
VPYCQADYFGYSAGISENVPRIGWAGGVSRCRMDHCRTGDSVRSSSRRSSASPSVTSRPSPQAPSVTSVTTRYSSQGQSSLARHCPPDSPLATPTPPSSVYSSRFDDSMPSRNVEYEKRRYPKSSLPAGPSATLDEYSRPHLPYCRLYRASDLLLYEKYKAGRRSFVFRNPVTA